MPVGPIFSSLLKAGAMYAISELVIRTTHRQKKIKEVALGVAWLVGAAYLALVSLTGFLITFFLYLADVSRLETPALVTSSITLLLALLAGNESRRRFRRAG